MTDFEPTSEQKQILDAFKKGKNLKIHAFAGTGKTTTLKYLSSNTKKQGVYLAFNKRVANEAKKAMPDNVKSATIHSIAWSWAAQIFNKDQLLQSPNRTVLKEFISIPVVTGFSEYKSTTTISLVLKNFCNSRAKKIGVEHLPWDHISFSRDQKTLKRFADQFLTAAQKSWNMMCDAENELPLGHDGYLKLWSLKSCYLDYEFLLVDEAQDLSPVMLEVIDSFEKQKILVGDSQQQIYSWRGAVNALGHDIGGDELHLTQTFRYGKEVADLASRVLRTLGVEKPIVSNTELGTKIFLDSDFNAETYIFRKNASLIGKAVSLFQAGLPFYIVDPNRNIEQSVDDYFRLSNGLWGKSQAFEGFNSWDDVVALSKNEELTPFRGFVELFEQNDPNIIRDAVKSSKSKATKTYPTLTTGHQAKGLEWDNVYVSEDFSFSSDELNLKDQEEELRLLYVALTRAKKSLGVSKELLEFCETRLGRSEQKLAIIDLETTGLNPEFGDKITEVGFVIWQDGKIIQRYESLVNPGRPIPEFVQSLTGITNEMVSSARSSEEVLAEAMSMIGDIPLVAHNASFERKFLNKELGSLSSKYSVDLICSLLLARRIFPYSTGYKLGDLVDEFDLPKGNAHRALSDAEMTAHLVTEMHNKLLRETDGTFLLTADNLTRIAKAAPKDFRENGIHSAFLKARKRHSETVYSSYDFSGEKFNFKKKPVRGGQRYSSFQKIPISKPQTRAYEVGESAGKFFGGFLRGLKGEDQPIYKRGGVFGFLRKTLKIINGMFFGPLLLVGTYTTLTEPDKVIGLISLVIIFAFAWFIHSIIEKIFG